MLPEKVLEELKRDSPLAEVFVSALWSDLTLESKLQIIGGRLNSSLESKAWEFIKSAHPWIANELAAWLPTNLGLSRITLDKFLELPEQIITLLFYRSEQPEIRELIKHIQSNPKSVSEKIQKELSSFLERDYSPVTDSERERAKRIHSPEPVKNTLEILLDLKDEFAQLRHEINEMKFTKKGFFG